MANTLDVSLTKMSTKGQIVIPSDLRDDFSTGEKLLIIRSCDKLIIKKASQIDRQHAKILNLQNELKKRGNVFKKEKESEFVAKIFLKNSSHGRCSLPTNC